MIYINFRKSIEKNKYIILYSGGVDSSVLLKIIKYLLGKNNLLLININHNNIFFEKKYKNYSIKFIIKNKIKYFLINLKKKINFKKFGLECSLRNERNKILKIILKKYLIKNILSTEHKNDIIENFFIKFIRKIIYKKKYKNINYKKFSKIKIFKKINKYFIKKYAIKNKIKWIEDQSNLKKIFLRNKIRIKIMPIIKYEKII